MALSASEVTEDDELPDPFETYNKHLEVRLREGTITRADASDARMLIERANEAIGRKRLAFFEALDYILGFR